MLSKNVFRLLASAQNGGKLLVNNPSSTATSSETATSSPTGLNFGTSNIFFLLQQNFLELSEEHKQLQDAVRRFTREEIIPQAAHYDQTMKFPWEVIKKAHANGFMNVDIPTEYGYIFSYKFKASPQMVKLLLLSR